MNAKEERKDSCLYVETMYENLYLQGFLKELCLRPICYACPYRNFKSESDITIGDFWGIHNVLPEFDDDKGVSVVMINNKKGEELYRGLQVDSVDSSFEIVLAGNPCIETSVHCPQGREKFMSAMNEGSIFRLLRISTRPPFLRKLIRMILSQLGLLSIKRDLLWKFRLWKLKKRK